MVISCIFKQSIPSDMYRLKEILSNSFTNNLSVLSAVGTSHSRRDSLIDYSIGQAKRSGKIYDNGYAAALIIFKNKKQSFIRNFIPVLTLVIKSLRGNTFKISRKEKVVLAIHRQHEIPSNAVYLWYIGTHSSKQGEGHGSKLLSEIISEFHCKTIILETSVESNIHWYGRFGFEVYDVEELNGIKLYFLKREPGILNL